jgi:hypothetical protein
MKYAILLMPLLLTGCFKSIPVKMSFPDAPAEMKVACPDLKQVKENGQMSDVLETVTENYSQYHECRNKVDAWIEWHKQQKQISDSIK